MVATRITGRGVFQDGGAADFTCETSASFEGQVAFKGGLQTTTVPSGSVTLATPGFYYLWGSTVTTASVPLASTYAGATLICTNLNTASFMLTGSAVASGQAVFALPTYQSGSVAAAKHGSAVSVGSATALSSIAFLSDGVRWMVTTATGTLTFSGAVV